MFYSIAAGVVTTRRRRCSSPGVGEWNNVFLLRDLWHFHVFGKTPPALVTGRERIYLEHFWNDFAADAVRARRTQLRSRGDDRLLDMRKSEHRNPDVASLIRATLAAEQDRLASET
jgi:hypothetical protein